MGEEYDFDISEIDFEGNQIRMRKLRKKQRRHKLIVNIFEFILATIFALFIAYVPALIELLI